jgi:hypothetical protein
MPTVFHAATPIGGLQDVLDLIGMARWQGADWVSIPATALPEAFFDLRTRLAGELLQRFAQRHVGVAIVGSVAEHVERNAAFGDFVAECNRGSRVWFVRDNEELEQRLDAAPA